MSKQVKFNLDEEEEIHFKLSVKGSSNLPNVKPIMRFIISENSENGNIAIVLPAKPTEEGVVVNIPQLKDFFSEEKEYIGKLEIIVGNRYFSPTAMNIGFTKSFDIQAEPILKEISDTFQVDNIETSSKIKDKKPEFQSKKKLEQPVLKENKESEKSSIDEIPDEILAALEMEPIQPVVKKPEIKSNIKQSVVENKKPIKQLKKEPIYKKELKKIFRDVFNDD